MRRRVWRERAQDIVEAIARIERYVGDVSAEQFYADTKTSDAVIRNLQVIGEAARELSTDPAAADIDVPWDLMTGMRNVLVHGYFRVDLRIVWKTAREDLKPLKDAFMNALASRPAE